MSRDRQFESDKYQITISKTKFSEDTAFPSFAKPSIAGCFSLDSNRKYIEGPEFLKFCRMPESSTTYVNFDLNRSSDTSSSDEADESQLKETSELVQLLHWIRRHEDRFKKWRPHFVCYRGLMSKILGTPYEDTDGWKVAAMLKNGTIYLRNLETPESISNRQKYNSNPRLKRFAAWGYTFEHFLLSDMPNTKPDPTNSKKEECNIVFQTRLGSHNILYAAEIDGVLVRDGNDANPRKNTELLQSSELVELKTARYFNNGEMPANFRRFQLRKWWCQSFTAGISHVIVGCRDDEGVVHELKTFPLGSLPKMGLDWSSTVCFNFLDQFLVEVKRMVGRDETSVYVLEYTPVRKNLGNVNIFITVEKNSDKLLPNLL